MTRVVIADIGEPSDRGLGVETDILGPGVTIEHLVNAEDEARLIDGCRDADAVVADLVPITAEVIAAMPRCRLISVMGTGYSHIDLDAARAHGVSVCAVGDYCTEEVADHVLLLILALCRRLKAYQDLVEKDRLWQWDRFTGLARLQNLTLGIVGFGKIGRAVARRARGFGMTVIAYDEYVASNDVTEPGVRMCEFDELLQDSDVISLNCGLSPDNEHLVNEATLSRMRRKPVLINCARGELVDEAALAAALDSGQVSAAGLDVLHGEPPDLATSKLTGRDNVIITPHVAFYSDASILACRQISARNVRHFLDGRHELVDRYVYNSAEKR